MYILASKSECFLDGSKRVLGGASVVPEVVLVDGKNSECVPVEGVMVRHM